MQADLFFMRRALVLARKGIGRTSPNPPVGAVIVRRGRIVGEGFHRRVGEAHAEVVALEEAGSRALGATLYVTLEPCAHCGRTPPCTDALLGAGIKRVVVGVRDPNPHVSGGGVERLRSAGLTVTLGVAGTACEEVISAFSRFVRSGRPLVTLKLAASLDGRIATATGASRWISGESSRRYVHRLRDQMDAVMVGAGTVLADDPRLTCRRRGGRDPLRVVVDGRLRIPLSAQVMTRELSPGTMVVTACRDRRKIDAVRRRGAEVAVLPGRRGCISMEDLMTMLASRGVVSVLLEGGATLASAALRERVVDRVFLFLAPKLIGGDGRAVLAPLGVRSLADVLPICSLRISRVGEDFLLRGVLEVSHAD